MMKNVNKTRLSDKDIAVYALYLLGGWNKRIHTEDVALECFRLAPNRFSWTKYPEYPDLTPARFALESTKKSEYGHLVKGESERKKSRNTIGGWMLTEAGIRWVKLNKSTIESSLEVKKSTVGNRLHQDRRYKEMLGSNAFIKFINDGDSADISHAEFAESLICTVNTDSKRLNNNLDLMQAAATTFEDRDALAYIKFLRKKFPEILNT